MRFTIQMIIVAIVVGAAIVVPVAACYDGGPHDCDNTHPDGICPDGLVCKAATFGPCQECQYVGPTYGPWGSWELGKCPGEHGSDTCEQEHVSGPTWHHHHRSYHAGYYQCHITGYVSCDGLFHEKQILTTAECIACPQGQHKDGDNLCVPDVCGVDYCTGEDQFCDGQECVICPDHSHVVGEGEESHWVCDAGYTKTIRGCEILGSTFAPFTEAPCREVLTHPDTQLTGVDVTTLPILDLKNAEIRASVTYGSELDCAALSCYVGDPSFSGSDDCTKVEYWNLIQLSDIQYGGGVLYLRRPTPVVACQLLVVKNSPETSLPVGVVITDSHDTVGYAGTYYQQVFRYLFRLPDDFGACRPRVATPPARV